MCWALGSLTCTPVLSRKMSAETSLLVAVVGRQVEALAAGGAVAGPDHLPLSLAGGFVGRVLPSEHAAAEPLSSVRRQT
jgi:hypothetical protein